MANTTISGTQLITTGYDSSAYNVVKYKLVSETETSISYQIHHGIIFPNYTNIGSNVTWSVYMGVKDDQTSLDYINSFGTRRTIYSDSLESDDADNFYYYSGNRYTYTKTTSTQTRYFQTSSNNLQIETVNGDNISGSGRYIPRSMSAPHVDEAVFTLTIPALNQYTVTFYANDHGTAPAAQTIYYGYTASTPTSPTATGWTFGGWYTESACTNAWNFNTPITGNTNLYAKWTVNTYTITYNDNGGTGTAHVTTQSKKYNAAVTLHNATQDGFIKFDTTSTGAVRQWLIKSTGGWNTKSNGTGTSYNPGAQLAAGSITSNLWLYAQWEATYIYPTITNLKAIRTATASSNDEDDEGVYLKISFNWTGYSNNGGSTFSTPTCKITIDGTSKTVTLNSTQPYVYRPTNPSTFSSDATHTIQIELYDPDHTTHKATASVVIPTAILPIDLYGSGSNVYMGIMHNYISGQIITIPNLYVDTDGSGTDDTSIRTSLTNLGWGSVLT